MPSPVVCPRNPLTRDLDVQITLSRPQTEIATDMTLVAFLTPGVDFPPDNGRVRYYSSFAALQADVPSNSAAFWAGKAFFDRAVRPSTMAIGAVFEDPVAAGLMAGTVDITALSAVTDGALDLVVNGNLVPLTGMNFSGVADIDDVVTVLAAELASSAAVQVSADYGSIVFRTVIAGENTTIDYPAPPSSGVDVSGFLGLTKEGGATIWPGYIPQGLASEAALVRTASRCNGRLPYGYVIDAMYRDTDTQKPMADWAESNDPSYFSACTNSAAAYNSADSENIGFYCQNKGYRRTSVIYHNNPQVYPDMSYIAFALATNYALPDSAITMKFKELDGIEPSPISETELSILDSRGINAYVFMGNTSRVTREGKQSADTWFTDSLVNLDNFKEELQVEVFNVFLRNGKVPYTAAGQNKLVSAAAKICRRYTTNGVFANRDVETPELESGFRTLPATQIIPVPVAAATTSERAERRAPPILIVAYEAGAMHRVAITVNVYA